MNNQIFTSIDFHNINTRACNSNGKIIFGFSISLLCIIESDRGIEMKLSVKYILNKGFKMLNVSSILSQNYFCYILSIAAI